MCWCVREEREGEKSLIYPPDCQKVCFRSFVCIYIMQFVIQRFLLKPHVLFLLYIQPSRYSEDVFSLSVPYTTL